MSVRQIPAGSTDKSINVIIVDSTDGTPETGVVYNTSGMDLWYRREGAAKVSITEASLSSLTDAHSDGGFLEISNGKYRLDLPDAALAAGVDGVEIGGTVTDMVVIAPYIELTTDVPQTGDAYARLGAPAGASVSADVAAVKSDSAAILVDTGTTLDGKIDSILTDTGTTLDGKIDSILADTNELQADDTPAAIAALEASLVTISEYIDTEVAAIKAVTDAIPDSGALTTIDSNIDAVKAVTDALPDSGALSSLATSTALSTVDDVVDAIKLVVDAILLDTAEIGTAGAGLTNLGGMSTEMKAEVLAEQIKLLTTQMTESYATDGTEPTLAEALFLIQQSLHEFSISSTTRTVKKLDGATTAATFTLDDDTSPTSTTRAS